MREMPRTAFDAYDLLFLVCLFALAVMLAAHTFGDRPAEDAAILMRYSQHLAQGHGIVWNVGERPVEGATDFLFMVTLAGLAKLGLSLVAAARLVDLVAHALTVCLIYTAIRPANRAAAALSASYLALGPAFAYISTCFGAPLFAFFAGLTWWMALRLCDAEGWTGPFGFALSGLMLGLTRPEGVILSGLMLVAIVYRDGWQKSQRAVGAFILVFGVLGGAYFLWRWHYFGYLLPNPFYVKGRFTLHWAGLWASGSNASKLLGPVLLVYALGLSVRNSAREAAVQLAPIAGFTLAWILLNDEQNLFMRFQYAVVPIALLSWYPLWRRARTGLDLHTQGVHGLGTLVVLGVMIVLLFYRGAQWAYIRKEWSPNYDIARLLETYQEKGYTIATTEPGILPFYSGWRTLDTWGLNNPAIAHRGHVTEADLDATDPQLLVFSTLLIHSRSAESPPEWLGRWLTMVHKLKDYAERKHYTLAAFVVLSNPDRIFYYYVRRDFPDSLAIIESIRSQRVAWAAQDKLVDSGSSEPQSSYFPTTAP